MWDGTIVSMGSGPHALDRNSSTCKRESISALIFWQPGTCARRKFTFRWARKKKSRCTSNMMCGHLHVSIAQTCTTGILSMCRRICASCHSPPQQWTATVTANNSRTIDMIRVERRGATPCKAIADRTPHQAPHRSHQ